MDAKGFWIDTVVAGSNGCSTPLRLARSTCRMGSTDLCSAASDAGAKLDNRLRDVVARDGPPGAATTLLVTPVAGHP